MANFRQIHVSIWKDPWFMDLDPEQKLLFIYLFSNESASLSGIYEIPLKVICFETDLSLEFVKKSLDYFREIEKVYYDSGVGVVWVKNLRKYNASSSYKVRIRVKNDIAKIPDCSIKRLYITYYPENIGYGYDVDILSTKDYTNEVNNNENEMKTNKDPLSIVSSLYEQEIGALTPMIGEQIKDWVDNYPLVWLQESIEIASGNQKRTTRYINGILKNWKTDGRGNNRLEKKDDEEEIDMEKQREEEAKASRERIEGLKARQAGDE